MDDIVYLNNLYDYYGELLTDKQRNYFEDYYFQNLTLQEISENYKISRNAVHKQIKEVEIKLYFYEEKLKLYDRNEKLKKEIEKIKDNKIKEEIKRIIGE